MTSTIDKRDRFGDDVFTFRATKSGKVFLSWQGKQIKTLAGEDARRFLGKIDGLDRRDAQLLMAKITGNFKHGNERQCKP
ncbi:MAG: hypothetical protein ACRDJH_23035 [Thermomicrobiales bacterium]